MPKQCIKHHKYGLFEENQVITYLPLKSSMFSHLEPIPVRILGFGYLCTLDDMTRYQNDKYFKFLASKKAKNLALLNLMWSQKPELAQIQQLIQIKIWPLGPGLQDPRPFQNQQRVIIQRKTKFFPCLWQSRS